MRRSITARFEVQKVLRKSPSVVSFQGLDRWTNNKPVFVKLLASGRYQPNQAIDDNLSRLHGLKHPFVANVHDAVLTPQKDFYVARAFIDGVTIPTLGSGSNLAVAGAIVSACSLLQSMGVVHGRLKLGNVIVTPNGAVTLVDGGLPTSVSTHESADLTFIAPEVLEGAQPDLESDLYSLGALLYRLLSGEDLFEDSDATLLRRKCLSAAHIPLADRCVLDSAVTDAVEGLLTKEPAPRRGGFERVLAALPISLPPAERATLAGRQIELRRISRTLEASDPGLHVLTVEGETGAGKTRILEHLRFLRSLHGGQTLIGRSFERNNRPFEPILQALTKRFGQDDQKLERWIASSGIHYADSLCHLLPDAASLFEGFRPSSGPPARGKIIADLTGTLVSLFAGDSSLVLALDDAHWIDEGTLEILEQLSWRATKTIVQIVASSRTYTSGESWRAAMTQLANAPTVLDRITLEPLHHDTALAMCRELVVKDSSASWVVKHSNGNPLFIEEYAKYEKSRQSRLPERLSNILLHEFSQYAQPEREAAQLLSLFPTPIDQTLVPSVLATLPRSTESSIAFLERGSLLVRTNGQLSFRHDGIRQAIYANISARRRRTLHGMLSALLRTTTEDWASIAHHADRAGRSSDALDAYLSAADECFQQDDFRTAIELLSSAQSLARRHSVTLPITAAFLHAESLMAVGRQKDARTILMKAQASQLLSSEESARLHAALSSSWIGTPDECLKHSRAAVNSLSPASGNFPRALLTLARAYGIAGSVREAKDTLAEAEVRFAAPSPLPPGWIASKGLTYAALCEHRVALGILGSIAPPEPSAARVFSNMALCLEHLGELEKAFRFQQMALDRSREYGFLFGEVLSLSNLAAFNTKSGNLSRAQSLFKEATDFAERARIHRGRSTTPLPLLSADQAALRMDQGAYGEARKLIATAQRQLKGDRSSQKAIWVALKAAELYGRTKEAAKAAAALRRVEESELFGSNFFAIERALITPSRETAVDADRIELLERCLQITSDLQTLYQRCRVLIELGAARLQLGDKARARKCLTEARELATEHGYKPLGVRIELLEGLESESSKASLESLNRAYRRAEKIGLAELAAECAFQIGELHRNAGRRRSARESLLKAVRRVDEMAATLPPSAGKTYLNAGWRSVARSALESVEKELHQTKHTSQTKKLKRSEDGLFRLTYNHAVQLNRVRNVHEVVAILLAAITKGLKASVVVYIDTVGEKEFHPKDQHLDDVAKRFISRLHKKVKEDFFIGGTGGANPQAFAWAPLRFQQHSFGGIYAQIGGTMTEGQIEFLTTIAVSASTALAALLWSTEPSPAVSSSPRYDGIVGRSPAIEGICAQIGIAAQNEATVLIEGESGTGKELVARAIHDNSQRSSGPFVTVDCGAIPETLIESELFGSLRGSFTGATTDRTGLIESSGGGTLFLDEIGNTSPGLQAKLLRVLQEREIRRLGDTKARKVDLRLIAATNSDLDSLAEQGEFRQDLLYRLKVLHVVIPPLRERREDIPEIANVFLNRLNTEHKTRKRLKKSALASIMAGNYKGNVRELQNVVERAYFSAVGQNVISIVGMDEPLSPGNATDVDTWFKKMANGEESFWKLVHEPYKSRDISREKVLALMDVGLRASKGSYKHLSTMLNLKEGEYRRFMDFLRRNKCQPDFRPYRRAFAGPTDPIPDRP